MEASGSSCIFATNRETVVLDQMSDEDPDPHPARGLGAILTAYRVHASVMMNLPSMTLV
ncbi:MAG: hypothetical protein NZ772_09195 [Cyanobacteria bacterium]|nr:hypothetical protein [Cyanobacteriota bacterium]MDW8201646.1 hypothetical protein [Cyanobacteriota bacterium SKYGB_h_bin112]